MAIDDLSFQRYKKMSTGQLSKAAQKLHAQATGNDPDEINWDSYDRSGLLEVVKLRHEQLATKGAKIEVVEVSVDDAQADVLLDDDGLTIGLPALSKRRVARPVDIETKEVTVDEDGNPVEAPAKPAKAPKEPKAPREKKVKEPVVKGPRKRRISDEVIQAIRFRRATVSPQPSYAKLAVWLNEEHGVAVTGDLVRSIIVREIYGDVVDLPLPEVEPAVTTADLEAAYVGPDATDEVDEVATEAITFDGLSDAHSLESDGNPAMDFENDL